jgi:ribonuclease VapC
VTVVDTSVLAAIFLKEEDWERLLTFLHAASSPRISAATLVETLIVLEWRVQDGVRERLGRLLRGLAATVEPVTEARALLAADAYRRYGKGYHSARLNYGDCFAYALAKELDAPLLYKGNDFAQTDIRSAL